MKNLKKAVSIFLVGLLTAGILTGCGNKNEADVSTATTPANSTAAAESAKEELPFVQLRWHNRIAEQPDDALVHAEINKILKEKINAEVEFSNLGLGTYEDRIKMIIASGEEYDLCFTADWVNNYLQNATKGAFAEVDELLEKHAPNIIKDIPEGFWGALKVDGKIYAVPNQQITARSTGIWVQKDLADTIGFKLDDIKTVADIEPFMKAAKEQYDTYGNTGNLLSESYSIGMDFVAGVNVPGAYYIKDSHPTVFNQFESSEYMAYINRNADWYKKGYFMSDFTTDNTKYVNDMKAKKYSWGLFGTYKPGGAIEEGAKYGFEMMEKQVGEAVLTSSGVLASLTAINKGSKNQERAMMLLDIINSDKHIYNLIVFGIENKHYTKTGENKIQLVADSKYSNGRGWAYGNVFNSFVLPGQPDDVWEQTKKLNMEAKASPLMGFAFNPEPVKAEIANCQNVQKEYDSLSSGQVDINKMHPAFIEKLKKAGSDKIIAEMQSQIDAFIAAKK